MGTTTTAARDEKNMELAMLSSHLSMKRRSQAQKVDQSPKLGLGCRAKRASYALLMLGLRRMIPIEYYIPNITPILPPVSI